MSHRGTFIGRTTREHGMSRQHHSVISTDAGGHIFSAEQIDLPSGTRVIFYFESGDTSETLAVNVKPIEIKPAASNEPSEVKPKPEAKSKPDKRRGDKQEKKMLVNRLVGAFDVFVHNLGHSLRASVNEIRKLHLVGGPQRGPIQCVLPRVNKCGERLGLL